MSWTTPKTDWEGTDNFNLADYNRITGNIQAMADLGSLMYFITISEMETADVETWYIVDLLNTIEDNLDEINNATYRLSYEKKTWTENRVAPNYEDFNRWETFSGQIYQKLEDQYKGLARLPFKLGNMHGFRE
jgi:hypothetical protein